MPAALLPPRSARTLTVRTAVATPTAAGQTAASPCITTCGAAATRCAFDGGAAWRDVTAFCLAANTNAQAAAGLCMLTCLPACNPCRSANRIPPSASPQTQCALQCLVMMCDDCGPANICKKCMNGACAPKHQAQQLACWGQLLPASSCYSLFAY